MFPVVFINCKLFPFVAWIISGIKLYETRTRNTLKSLVGKRILLAETGKGKAIAKCFATITDIIVINDKKAWKQYKKACCIKTGSKYDYIPGTKKYLYKLTDIVPVPEFIVPEGKRHGRIWTELYATEQDIMAGEVNDYKQWVADCYHCSELWGNKTTQQEMKMELEETERLKFPDDYSPDPSLYKECAAYWNWLCDTYPN